jgi:hypothetical protein
MRAALASLRRHAWLLGVLLALVVGYFVAIGLLARQLRSDLVQTVQPAPVVSDQQHRAPTPAK